MKINKESRVKEKRAITYSRILIGIVLLLLIIITLFNFFIAEEGSITTGLITIIVFLIILALSESFDNFSVSNLISISRDLKKEKEDNHKLTLENSELRTQLINISTSVAQSQNSTNIFGLSNEILRSFGVE